MAYEGHQRPFGNPVSPELTIEFRNRVLELHEILHQAIVVAGASLTVTCTSTPVDLHPSTAFARQRRATLGVRDTDALSGEEVTIELELENGKCVDLSYPRRTLRGIPSDVLAWALLRELDEALQRNE